MRGVVGGPGDVRVGERESLRCEQPTGAVVRPAAACCSGLRPPGTGTADQLPLHQAAGAHRAVDERRARVLLRP